MNQTKQPVEVDEDREIELILDIKKIRRLKTVARTKSEQKAYDVLLYVLTSWKEDLSV